MDWQHTRTDAYSHRTEDGYLLIVLRSGDVNTPRNWTVIVNDADGQTTFLAGAGSAQEGRLDAERHVRALSLAAERDPVTQA